MSATTIPYLYQLQGASYSSLSSTDFKIAVVDPDSSKLTNSQISSLEASGKTLYSYLAIGEAEPWRSYFNSNASYILNQDPLWGSYFVKFWDPTWQSLTISRAVAMAKAGYNGLVMDVVDVYNLDNGLVAAADGGVTKARADMMNFVAAISAATKAINPNFKIIQNNALDLLTTNGSGSGPTNTSYLANIDGVNTESNFYLSDNSIPSWSSGNLQYLAHAVSAGKVVFDIDYPTSASAQQAFITKAIASGFIPFVGNTALSTIAPVNTQIMNQLTAAEIAQLNASNSGTSTGTSGGTSTGGTSGGTTTGSGTGTSTGTSGGTTTTNNGLSGTTTINGVKYNVYNIASGNNAISTSLTYEDFVISPTYHGQSTIKYFSHDAHSLISIPSSIYSTAAQTLSHVTYSGSDAIIHLNGTDTITILGAGANSLTASDFNIYNSSTSTGTSGGTTTGTSGGTTNGSGTGTSTGTSGGTTTTTTGLSGTTSIGGVTYNVYNVASGNNAISTSVAYEDFVISPTYHGQSTIKYFSHDAHSLISIPSSIYSTAAQALSHVTYSGSDAIIHLNGTDTLTILGAGANSLTASDFNIYNSGTSSTTTTPTTPQTPATTITPGLSGKTSIGGTSYNVYNVPTGNNTISASVTYEDFVFQANYHGQTSIKYFAHDAHDLLTISSSIYATAAQALSHVTYSGSDAVVHLNGTDTITIVGAGANSLVASDFHIA